MASTAFTNGVTLTDAEWFNDVNTLTYNVLASVAGTNVVTATGPASLTAYANRQRFLLTPAATNTGATTLNITPSGGSALGAKNIYRNGAALVGGELRASRVYDLAYDGTQFNVMASSATADNKATAIASAATCNIWAADGDYVHITGNTGPITSFGTAPYAGARKTLIFDSTPSITHNATSLVLPGGANYACAANDRMEVRADTTANAVVMSITKADGTPVVQGNITTGTMSTTTGGTAIAFTGLPVGIKEIDITWKGLSASGTSQWIVQIGDATTGDYVTSSYEANAGSRGAEVNSTAGFPLLGTAPAAASVYTGSLTLKLLSGNVWVVKCGNNCPVSGTPSFMQGHGTLAGSLDRIRITATNGTDTFDANAGVNISYST